MEEIRMNIKNNKNCKITINDEKIGKYTIKTADEMFDELGYEIIENNKTTLNQRIVYIFCFLFVVFLLNLANYL